MAFVEDPEDAARFEHIEASAHPDCVAWVRYRIQKFMCISDAQAATLFTPRNNAAIAEFLLGDETKLTLWAMWTARSNDPDDETVLLRLNVGQPNHHLRLMRPFVRRDMCYFLRADPRRDVAPETIDQLVICGSMKGGVGASASAPGNTNPADSLLRTMHGAVVPTLLANRAWPDSIQKEFSVAAHNFMATVTENANRMHGRTLLYVPILNLTDEQWKTAHLDKELVQTLMAAVIHWTRQIREVINEKDVEATESAAGPLAEIEYWRARTRDLNNIRAQFIRADVVRIVDALAPAKEESKYSLEPFLSLRADIEAGTSEAIDNLRYLRTLEAPCRQLAEATPREIPALLPQLLRTVHMVFMHSQCYKRDRFFRLLRMISNEIVQRCRAQINLRAIFDGQVEGSMTALQESVAAGEAWMAACRKMMEITAKRFRSERAEQLEMDDTVYSEIDGFVKHRCMNLMEVCRGQLQFGYRAQPDPATAPPPAAADGSEPATQPPSLTEQFRGMLPCFGGAKGAEIESQLLDLQRAFKSQMENLRRLDYDILDIKATAWSTDFRDFKAELDSLTTMMAQIIQSSFDMVTTAEGGAELLEAFHYLAKRADIVHAVAKRKEGVFKLFQTELAFAQKERAKKNQPVLFMHPPHAGHAYYASYFRQRINHNYRTLNKLWYLRPDKMEAMHKAELASLDEVINRDYRSWRESLHPNPAALLDAPLVAERPLPADANEFTPATLAVNFPVELTLLLEEGRYWGRMGEPVPAAVTELLTREERLRTCRENVALAVRAWNNIVASLDPKYRPLFAMRFAHVSAKFAAGITKSNWNTQDIVGHFVRECRVHADRLQTGVDDFKFGVASLLHLCDLVGQETLAIHIEGKRVYRVPDFERHQAEYRAQIRQRLQNVHTQMTSILKSLFDYFRADYKDSEAIRKRWHEFLSEIEVLFEEAVKAMVKRSLQEFARALGTTKPGGDAHKMDLPSEKPAEDPLFELEVVIDVPDVMPNNFTPTPEARPSIPVLTQKVNDMSKEITSIVTGLPRLEEALTGVLDSETDAELEEKKIARVVHQAPGADPQGLQSYADFISSSNELLKLTTAIHHSVATIGTNVQTHVHEKIKLSEEKLIAQTWTNKETMLRRARTTWSPKDYNGQIDSLSRLETSIGQWDPFRDISFARLNYTPMKQTLRGRCQLLQDAYLNQLHEVTIEKLNATYNDMNAYLEKLRAPPTELKVVVRQQALEEAARAKMPERRAELASIAEHFAVLEARSYSLKEDDRRRKQELPAAVDDFAQQLDHLKRKVDENMARFRQDLESDLRSFGGASDALKKDLLENGPYSASLKCADAFLRIADYNQKLEQRRAKEASLKDALETFKIERPPQAELKDVEAELQLLTRIWELVDGWKRETELWKRSPFKQLQQGPMVESVETFRKDVMKLRKDLERRDVWVKLREDIELFKRVLPVVEDLLHPALRDRHWRQLMTQLDEQFNPDGPEFCLDLLLALRIDRQGEFISNLAMAAKQELKIETDLEKISDTWATTDLMLEEYHKEYFKIASVDDLTNTLTEHITMLSSMKMSRFVDAFKFKVQQWEQTLSSIADTIEALLVVQTKWMYLENIFVGSEDIKRKLVEESKLFDHVNAQWVSIMNRMNNESNVQKATRREGLVDQLGRMNSDLERIQKSLEGFLEDRRRAFPRFYFLSNDDLLEILGHTKDPAKVQPHLRKCFEGLFKLELDYVKKQMAAKAMLAADGERVPFPSAVQVEGVPVEVWLRRVEDKMRETVHRSLIATLDDLQRNVYMPKKPVKLPALQQWLQRDGQCLITATQINWTKEIERVIIEYGDLGGGGRRKANPVYKMYKKWKTLIKRYCELVREKMSRLQRNKLVALITIEVHARDIVNVLQALRVADVEDFEWMKQLRFYRDTDDACVIRQTSATVRYDYEYLGNSGRLVVTPLTDRAYMTLTTALQLQRGGLPQGPAGTGKTETVKDLGKAIAKYVMVFNCSDGLDFRSLGRMFSGLAQTGSWSCFDEFNRIEVEVLSVVAQQIFCILSAVAERKKNFIFEGVDIPLNLNCGIFVTMNPGYAGRSELPDNLKALLRPISMMVPDFTLICEITLLSQGFVQSQSLAKKVSILYELMEKQLSKQDHYDFSLRNIKAVLVQAGKLKRENFTGTEEQLCLKACSDMNLPKFVKDDVPLFLGMLSDLFPGVTLGGSGLERLWEQAGVELEASSRKRNEHIQLKVLHLWDTLNTRHGVMVVGASASGKTTTWQTLAGALKRLKDLGVEDYEPVRVSLINPKAVTMDELYGSYNQATREWKDGILSDMMRTICRDESLTLKWLLFDGPVDTLWIESMNTVLDDNKMLTLNSGERINMTPQVAMVFEVQDLAQASPATVSRCGMVYFNVEDLGWQPYVDSWLMSRRNYEISINGPKPEQTITEIETFIRECLVKAIEFRQRECTELFPTTAFNAVRSFCAVLDAIANPDAAPFIPGGPRFAPQAAGESYQAQMRMLCTYAMMWSLGATLDEDSRRRFDVMIREVDSNFPSSDTGFEYYVDLKSNLWRSWDDHPDLQRPFSAADDAPFYRLVVPTVDTVRHQYLVQQLVRGRVHTVLVGNTGTGKSLVARGVVRDLPQEAFVTAYLNFSAQTTSKNVQDIIEGKMERKSNKVYSPPGGRRMVCFIEDLNMPAKEKFGAQPPLELLRMWIDNGYWFDRSTQTRRQINDSQLLCCMTFGRPDISQRLLSKLNVINIPFPADTVVTKIFTSILSHRLSRYPELMPHCDLLVKATMQVYQKVTTDLLPIPSKSHYVFNLRDLSKVFQGIYGAFLDVVETKEQLVTLWMHEAFRVFSDRMNDLNDKQWFRNLIVEKLASLFSTKWSTLLRDGRNPIFVDFWDGELDEFAKYKLVPSNAELRTKLDDALDNFNSEPGARTMQLVFFSDAMEHLCRIHRIIRTPRGNALLVGLGGSGRSSLTRLACYLAGYNFFTIEIHKKYDLDRFHDDLRTLYRSCGGLKSQQRVFFISDTQIVDTAFLEDINNMLSVGEVPNLFNKDDMTSITDELRKEALEEGYRDTPDEIYGFFIDRARKNLHVVLAMSPAHKDFRLRLRQFPSFVSCTSIDWFVDWPSDALREVAQRLLTDSDVCQVEMREPVADMLVMMHDSTGNASRRLRDTLKRYNYVTPSSYLDLVRGYIALIEAKRDDLSQQANKLKNGMSKLDETKVAVAKMTEDLKVQEKALEVETLKVDRAMQETQQSQRSADEQQVLLSGEKQKIEREKMNAEAIQQEASAELEKAMPAFNAAAAALNSLDKRELQELRTYRNPPNVVRLIMQAVQTLLRRPTDWADATKTMNEPGFLEMLKTYDVNNMSPKLLQQLEKYVEMKDFDPLIARNTSNAASGLCQWCIAVHKYGLVYAEVAPRQARVAQAEARVAKMQADLDMKERALAGVLAKLQELRDNLIRAQAEKKRLQDDAAVTQLKLARANIIISGLEGERDRWTSSIERYELSIANLVGDGMLASGVLSYLGAFPAEYRADLMKEWSREVRKSGLPASKSFDFVEFLVDPTEVRDWQALGLPGDDFSRENGVIVTRGTRWPLMVDPQGQANRWIKRMEKDNGLKVIDPKQSDFMKTIEYAVQFGAPVLLQDILEEIDPALDAVVTKTVVRKNGRATIKIGDNYIDYNDNFRMYITTKLANPHYTPETCTKVCLLNFAVKEQGLEEQLLKIVVEKEKPELEEENDKLILSTAAAKKETKRLEDEILDLLTNSNQSLLENIKLIDTLQTSKQTAIAIQKQLKDAEVMGEKITAAREQFRECARRASILFFVLADLGSIDNMYQFALDAYILLFQNSIRRSAEKIRVDSVDERVRVLNDWHTGQVYSNTCRGLFERHKLLFAFHMTVRILSARGEVYPEEYAFFIKGGQVMDKESQTPNPAPGWLTSRMWDNIFDLEKLVNFHGVVNSFEQLHEQWHSWFLTERPEEVPLPGEWEQRVGENLLQRMIFVRSLRPDRILFMVQHFIEAKLDKRFVEPPPFNLGDTFDESRNILPLIFILSPGVDPTSQLNGLAERKGRTLKSLALGQGQDKNATKLILESAQSGGWVFLANCHLMTSWLGELEKIIDNLPNLRPHENFRLWLSSTPTPAFPIGILQRAIKMTTEPPNGIKANMQQLYNMISDEQFMRSSGDRPHLYRPLLFALCFFHSILLERRKFGTLGYNVVYDFTYSDFEVSENILALYIQNVPLTAAPEDLPFVTIRYLIAEASYGGRVTDDWDRRVINTYMDQVMQPATVGQENFLLAGNTAPEFGVPLEAPPLQTYREHCKALPLVDPPSAFGQHANADIASQIAGTMSLLDNLMTVNATLVRGGANSGAGDGGKAASVEDRVLQILATLDEQVPAPIDFDAILESTVDDRGSALNTCLLQEIQRYNVLLAKIRRQKAELRRAVKGEIVMNDELDIIYGALLVGRVPLPWQSAYPSVKGLAAWSQDLIERIEQMEAWGRAAPKVFWLSGFTYPTGFLKSLQQQQARRDQISIDQYGWEFVVLGGEDRTIMHAAKEGAYIRGIYLEGAGWDQDGNALTEPHPMELIVSMPIIHFRPKRREARVKLTGAYSAPMYMYPIRTGTRERPSFVLAVDLPAGKSDPEHWTKRGTALLLSTED